VKTGTDPRSCGFLEQASEKAEKADTTELGTGSSPNQERETDLQIGDRVARNQQPSKPSKPSKPPST